MVGGGSDRRRWRRRRVAARQRHVAQDATHYYATADRVDGRAAAPIAALLGYLLRRGEDG